ncbi:MAG: hypothetical protein ACYDA6_07340 [Solirubrobacteraceae bacterium]
MAQLQTVSSDAPRVGYSARPSVPGVGERGGARHAGLTRRDMPLLARVLVATAIVAAGGFAGPLAGAAQAGFGVSEANFEAGTCNLSSCTYSKVRANHAEAYTQSAGHPPYGLTSFEFNSEPAGLAHRQLQR